jgi:hypothetical protein
MRHLALVLTLACLLPARAQNAPETPAEAPAESPLARSLALELAGAFANDGFKLRDGFWSGTLDTSKPLFLQVNLFAGNQYWFSAAAAKPARKIAVSIFDAKGHPVAVEKYEDGASAAAGIEPTLSGPYIVRVELLEGEKSDFCLIYSYK